jgi:hypothetical protein
VRPGAYPGTRGPSRPPMEPILALLNPSRQESTLSTAARSEISTLRQDGWVEVRRGTSHKKGGWSRVRMGEVEVKRGWVERQDVTCAVGWHTRTVRWGLARYNRLYGRTSLIYLQASLAGKLKGKRSLPVHTSSQRYPSYNKSRVLTLLRFS